MYCVMYRIQNYQQETDRETVLLLCHTIEKTSTLKTVFFNGTLLTECIGVSRQTHFEYSINTNTETTI